MWDVIKSILGIGNKILEKAPDAVESRKAQIRINEAEITGAPASRLRLWRSLLGWALSLAFIWEVMARPIVVTYWPDLPLPPSAMKEITTLLLGMLGLGF